MYVMLAEFSIAFFISCERKVCSDLIYIQFSFRHYPDGDVNGTWISLTKPIISLLDFLLFLSRKL